MPQAKIKSPMFDCTIWLNFTLIHIAGLLTQVTTVVLMPRIPWCFADQLEFSHVFWECFSTFRTPGATNLVDVCWKLTLNGVLCLSQLHNSFLSSPRIRSKSPSEVRGYMSSLVHWRAALNSSPLQRRRLDETRPSSHHRDRCMSFSFMPQLPALPSDLKDYSSS